MSDRNGQGFVMTDKRRSAIAVVSAATRVVSIAVCVLLLLTGCGSWFQKTIRAEEGALSEVRSVGRVVAQTTEDPVYRDVIQIEDVLVMDVDASAADADMDVARRLLEQRGWDFIEKVGSRTLMNSTRWKDTSLTIEPFQKDDTYAGSWREYIAQKVQVEPVGRNKYLLVVVSRSHP
ncbi:MULTISPECIES: hypothetical protein [unclassified Nonomuraea]|uniref:hypothetical protein n=1 Tax=unclassified Nonomuraea TaxID=2593643 RepID=UPI0033D873DF